MQLAGERIYLRFYQDKDAKALCELFLRNREFFQKYSPARGEDFYALESRRKAIKDGEAQRERDERYTFGIFLKGAGELIGSLSLSEVLRGSSQSCLIGYSLDKRHNGKGYMTEAVSLAVRFAFDKLKLHRIEAGVMPCNTASIRVLEKAGFRREGIARKNVEINGAWEDHLMLAILSDDV